MDIYLEKAIAEAVKPIGARSYHALVKTIVGARLKLTTCAR